MPPGTIRIPSRQLATLRTMLPSGAELKSKSRPLQTIVRSMVSTAPDYAPYLPEQVLYSAQAPAPNSPQRDLEVLRRLEEEYLRAEIEDDTAVAGIQFLPMTMSAFKPDGTTSTKADVLSRLDRHERRREPYLITATNMRQHLFGDTACVTYTKVYTKPGTQAAFSENVLHVLMRHNGIWRLQLSSLSVRPRNLDLAGGCATCNPFFPL